MVRDPKRLFIWQLRRSESLIPVGRLKNIVQNLGELEIDRGGREGEPTDRRRCRPREPFLGVSLSARRFQGWSRLVVDRAQTLIRMLALEIISTVVERASEIFQHELSQCCEGVQRRRITYLRTSTPTRVSQCHIPYPLELTRPAPSVNHSVSPLHFRKFLLPSCVPESLSHPI
jgi:hypothetical protein